MFDIELVKVLQSWNVVGSPFKSGWKLSWLNVVGGFVGREIFIRVHVTRVTIVLVISRKVISQVFAQKLVSLFASWIIEP